MFLPCILFFGSGFAALVYELLWFRHLGFVFGNTVFAATTVLTAYMTGLALGAHLIGRVVRRVRRPIAVFGAIEAGIGLYALLIPFLFAGVRQLYRFAAVELTDSLPALTALRFVLALIVLIVPTTLMGATLPLLVEGLARERESFGRKVGLLYGMNTLGAVAGILSAGFVLIPTFGLSTSGHIAAACNLLVGFSAIAVFRDPASVRREEPDQVQARIVAVPLIMMVSGFIALAAEVIWFRALILIFGSTTYSFCAMLSSFLFGIAAGSLLLSWLADRVKRPLMVLAMIEVAIGISLIGVMYLFNGQARFILEFLVRHGFSWTTMVTAQFLITFKFLLIPTLLMGFAFPLATRAVRAQAGNSGTAVARVYTANTIGCVAGSVAGGFLLLPMLGIERSLLLLGLCSIALGLVIVWTSGATVVSRLLGSVIPVAAAAYFIANPPHWDRNIMTAGPHFSPWLYVKDNQVVLEQQMVGNRLRFYEEGITATVAVTEQLDGALAYTSSGKVEADTSSRSMMLQRLAGHLPMLFHPDPRRVINIGLGAGVSFGALSCYPSDHLEVVEIEPGAIKVAEVFGPFNHQIMKNPRAQVTLGDGRNRLFCATNGFDVITSDPFEPVHAGANHLYTRDHFQLARSRLNPGGIMSQYVPMYELSAADYQAILRSFVEVFPESVLFYTGEDTILLGFNGKVDLDPARVRERFDIPAVRDSLAEMGFTHPETILGMFVADLRQAGGLIVAGELNTDDHPVVEYSAPKSALRYTTFENAGPLLDNFTALPASFLESVTDEQRTVLEGEHEGLRTALQANLARDAGDIDKCYELLLRANELAPNNPIIGNELMTVIVPSATALMKAGDIESAAQLLQMALQLQPDDFWSLHHLINLAMSAGNTGFAGQLLDRAMQAHGSNALVLEQSGKYLASTGRAKEGLIAIQKAVLDRPERPEIWNSYAIIARLAGENIQAERALSMVKLLTPSSTF